MANVITRTSISPTVTLPHLGLIILAAVPTARGHAQQHGLVRGAGNGSLILVIAESVANANTDGDGMEDGWEVWNALDPQDSSDCYVDLDGDGLDNLTESWLDTLICEVDTDGDGFWDGIEFDGGTDPALAGSCSVPSQMGDVDADGNINACDIQFVTNGMLGLPTPFPVDVDQVGDITAMDLQMVINAALTA